MAAFPLCRAIVEPRAHCDFSGTVFTTISCGKEIACTNLENLYTDCADPKNHQKEMTMNSNLTDALANLKHRILTNNQEFPDACWNAASQYNVPYEELADAYDADCAN